MQKIDFTSLQQTGFVPDIHRVGEENRCSEIPTASSIQTGVTLFSSRPL